MELEEKINALISLRSEVAKQLGRIARVELSHNRIGTGAYSDISPESREGRGG